MPKVTNTAVATAPAKSTAVKEGVSKKPVPKKPVAKKPVAKKPSTTESSTSAVKPPKAESPTKAEKAPKAPKPPKVEKVKAELSGNAIKILKALKNTTSSGKKLNRMELVEKTSIANGWAKMLGAPTKENVGGLEGSGHVKSSKLEGEKVLSYYITEKGLKSLESVK